MNNSQLSFVFPGQGSQSKGMLSELVDEYEIVRLTYDEASVALGFDLWQLILENPQDKLNLTSHTQPALLASSVAIWRLWIQQGGDKPAFLAGHSLGEYSALVCAGVISLKDAVSLVADRGKFMQEAVPEGSGAMAAILGLPDEQVIEICAHAAQSEVVSAANFNSNGQVVIAGDKNAIERAIELAKEQGAKRAMLLAVSVPSHCALMREAAERFAERMELIQFANASIPIIQNVDAEKRTDAEAIKKALLEQLYCSVHWWLSVTRLKELGSTTIIECGPGKVLSGLIKRIDRSLEIFPVHDSDS
ncbi:MAG: ACP S-malonyltransferase [Gammaproteobacteria bacterium]|nr:ACP S-malonyltransferase [Gammaproteobacteria bacterium]